MNIKIATTLENVFILSMSILGCTKSDHSVGDGTNFGTCVDKFCMSDGSCLGTL